MTRFVGTPLTGIEFASASSEAFSARVDEDSNPRIRIDAGGRITWSSGAASGDVILERSAADTLSLGSGDIFKTPVIYVDNIEIDTTGATTGQVLKFDGVKFAPAADATGSGGSSNLDDLLDVVIVSATTGQFLKFNGTNWVNSAIALDDLSDVVITSPEEFQGLSYNGTSWVNSHIPLVSYVRNAESTTITTGTCVYLFGSTGDHATVKRADNDSDATSSKTMGVAGANIAASQNGPIITRGYVDGIDLSTGYDAGDILWLGEDGGFTKTKPTAPEHIVFIGVVVRATSNGIIYVATQNGYELDELHDVSIASRTSGDFLKYNGTLWVNDQIDLGTDTTGNYMVDVSAGTGVTVTHTPSEGSTATIAIGQAVAATDSPTFAGLTINGPSIVFEGATADSFETTLTVADPTTSDKTVTIPNTTGTLITTGDTGTVTSTMIADSTIVNGDISASAAIALSKLASGSSAQIIVADGSGVPTYATVSGDITISNTGVATIAANSVALGTDTTGNYMTDVSAGTGISVTHTPGEGSTATIANSGVLSINGSTGAISGVVTTTDTGTVTSTMIADGTIVNGDINASAAIALSKLANGSSAQVILGNSSGVPTYTTVSGDVTISDTGVTAIGSGVIVNADISNSAAIAHSKLANASAGQVLLGTTTTGVITATTLSGDVTINGAGTTAIGSGVIVNDDVSASAAIALSKLASGTSGQIVVANASGVPTYATVSGDITISDTGVAAIAANSVALGTDTTGDYVASLVAGYGIALANNSGEGATPTVKTSFVGAKAYRSNAISRANNSFVNLTFNAQEYDTHAFFAPTSANMTIPSGLDGYYLVQGSIEFAANATGLREAGIQLNGTNLTYVFIPSAGSVFATIVNLSAIVYCVATDVLTLDSYQNSGGALNILGSALPSRTWFAITFLGA